MRHPEGVMDTSTLPQPVFLMCPPFTYSTALANNIRMEEMDDEKRKPDSRRALTQFFQVYRYLASEGLVYVLPSRKDARLQDQVFVANLGIVLEHDGFGNSVIVSNYTSEARRGESPVGAAFFRSMGFDVHESPALFEGEAELKHLYGNVYIGGYGIRSEEAAYEWMENTFDMKVIKVRMHDPYLFHLDTLVFPLTNEKTIVCTERFDQKDVAELEKHTEIIDVSADDAYSGICNSVRVGNTVVTSSHIHELKRGTEDHSHEVKKNRRLEDILAEVALEVKYFNLSEYHKGGGLLSCMVMHLNRFSYQLDLASRAPRPESNATGAGPRHGAGSLVPFEVRSS